jgi:hypothetical protein
VHLAVGGCCVSSSAEQTHGFETTNEKQIEGNHNRVCIIPNYDVQRIAQPRRECGFMTREFSNDLF